MRATLVWTPPRRPALVAFAAALGLYGCGDDSVYFVAQDAGDDAAQDAAPDAAPPDEPCIVDLGPTSPAGACDGSGYCGGVSEAKGCIHCAMKGACGDHYLAANLDQTAWAAWNTCISKCRTGDSPDWRCCDRKCDEQHPEVAAAMHAWMACTFCQYCVQDCGGQPSDGDLRCQ